MIGGATRAVADAAGFPNTYGPGNRADLRLGTDSTGRTVNADQERRMGTEAGAGTRSLAD